MEDSVNKLLDNIPGTVVMVSTLLLGIYLIFICLEPSRGYLQRPFVLLLLLLAMTLPNR